MKKKKIEKREKYLKKRGLKISNFFSYMEFIFTRVFVLVNKSR